MTITAASATAQQTAQVTVYSKPACVQCVATKRKMGKLAIEHDTIDLTQDEVSMDLVQALGYVQAPVVVVRDMAGEVLAHWSGFNPDRIKELAAA
ncbi:glutaredoxin family protein [Brachybacterium sp. JHP9]|uniref:Glutaredoxin family protein n=1 Tax=Brachybacterium equifaecis TaxID=2910770 RepID=A0ABT0R6B5_9MICO|nr:glutaredoxin family protein [Brachybacterium equifaecis]MCL6424450.1 glutaredoxin family protein [Brachybacterium equifaecis]